MLRFGKSVVVVLLFCLVAAVFVSDARRRGEEALIQRRYAEAAVELRKALAEAPPQERDRVQVLLGRALQLAGDAAGAMTAYRAMLQEHPASDLRARARFRLADTLAASGDQREAAAIYRDEVERLIGQQRKEQIAETYLSLAEKALRGEKPDYARAVTFHDLALDLGLSADKARSVRLAAAEARVRGGKADDALARLVPLVRELDVAQGKLQAMLLLGQARAAQGDQAGARAAYSDLIALAKDSPEAGDAAFGICLAFGVPTPQPQEVDRALAALDSFAQNYPAHQQAKLARYLAARSLRHVGRADAALAAYRRFVEERGSEELAEVAAARAAIGDVLAGQNKPVEALAAWQAYLTAHPAHAEWERVQRAIVDTEWGMAVAALQRGVESKDFADARARLEAFGRAYPLDERNPEALRLLGEMLAHEQKFAEAVAQLDRCVRKYPGKQASSHAQFRIGELYEGELFSYLDALQAYRKVTWGTFAPTAQQRVARLERKHLELATERTYRTGEPATFKLVSRNLDKVRVRVFRLDMETYFRATHTAGRIEALDIEVIEADKTFENGALDYQQYRQTERDVDIGMREPGAYVVKVDAGDLEATTMVLVTDLALLVKTSRHELFAFTQNLKENRVEGGVKVLVSDGTKVLAEGVTGADGVYRYKGDALRTTARLQVFAVNAAGSGAGTLELDGLGYSAGLQPVGYLFTDRPAYQPGQVAHVKGIVREVRDGLYTLPAASSSESKGYKVQAWTAGGKLTLQREIEFTPFGSFAVDVALPPEAELGRWRVAIARDDGTTFGAEFTVARYERPKLAITAELATPVVYRGEAIEGRFLVRYFFGEPAAGKPVHIQMSATDGTVVTRDVVTNAAGEVAFRFDTKDFAEDAFAVIEASLAEESVATRVVVPIATTEFTPAVTVARGVVLAGEQFGVTVELKDRAGKSVQRSGVAVLLRRERRGAALTEVEVARAAFTTEGVHGKAAITLTAKQGGDHVVRVEAKDRFGVLVTGEATVLVSGDDDTTKLRLLGDQETYKTGETATFKVVNRAGARLALQTVQGDGILAYRSFVLPAGESRLDVKLDALHAPNFALALTLIDGTKLHLAERSLLVSRDLQVSVTAPATARPGAKLPVEIVVHDAEGRPVAAELALAMVDEALLAVHPDATPPMARAFWGKLRETAFRTASSCGWSYRGVARGVSAELLAEERRLGAIDLPRLTAGLHGEGESNLGPSGFDVFAIGDAVQQSAGGAGGGQAVRLGARVQNRAKVQQGQVMQDVLLVEEQLEAKNAEHFFYAGNRGVNTFGHRGFADTSVSPLSRARTDFSETGAWLSAVVTDAEGKARVELPLPDSTTAWAVVARAITARTDVGEARATVRTRKDLQASLRAPVHLTEGDRIELRGGAHNLTDAARSAQLAVAFGAQPPAQRDLQLAARAEADVPLAVVADRAGSFELRASATAGDLRDELVQPLVVAPFGRELRAARTGTTSESVRLVLALPAGQEYLQRALTLALGPDLGRDLVALALGDGYEPLSCRRVEATNLALASRGFAALVVLDWLERSGGATPDDILRLRGQAAATVSRLLATQRADGAFGWVKQAEADLRTTSQVLLFATFARKRGLVGADDLAHKTAEWLLAQLPRSKDRSKPLLALAAAGRARFEDLNALHRERGSLGLDALARLALAWQLSARPTFVGELADVLRARLTAAQSAGHEVEAIALGAAALLGADARDAAATQALVWLDGRRVGVSLGTPEATAAGVWASTIAGGKSAAAASEGEIVVLLNGRELAKVPAAARTDRSVFRAPVDWLRDGDNVVELKVGGRARVHYQATLTGFAKGFPAESDVARPVRVDRRYLAAWRRHDGKLVRPGFNSVQGTYQSIENRVSRVEVAQSVRAELRFWVPAESIRAAIGPIVVEEPIPAGCSVAPESIRGSYDHVEIEPDQLTFYYREGTVSDAITYDLEARFVGEFRSLPTQVYGAVRPDLWAHGQPGKLRIDARGQGQAEPYVETPDELLAIGKALFDQGDYAGAGARLGKLLADWHKDKVQLRDEVFRDVARMALFVAIAQRDAKATVRFFEELKDRYADLVIPFDKIVAVGQAYVDLGEFERALMVFRATAEASYLKDAAVATTLQGLGELGASVRFLRRLLQAYPDLNLIRTSLYSLAQKQAGVAAGLAPGAAVDAKVGSAADLRGAALAAFREFLVNYPEDPLAEEVSFAWATTLVEARDLAGALAIAEAALQRYPNSAFTDELLYTAGYAQFALGKPEPAFALLQRVATEAFVRADGSRGPSENRDHAIYLQGQVHHALGQPEQALAAYERVKDKFSDAVEATDYFLRKVLALPEVSTVGAADPAKVEVQFRNVARAQLTVFRVDLMRLYLLHKSLNDIRGVQLHGIRPYLEQTVELGTGRDYRNQAKALALDLKEPGAYLVVLRGDEQLATGMLLRSDLRLEAQEALDVGRLRVNIKSGDQVLADAHVKVIGSVDQRLRSGDSDLRGVFVADDLVGAATVIVKKGDQYAFYRGTGVHQPQRIAPKPADPAQQVENKPGESKVRKDFDAWSNNRAMNDAQRGRQVDWLEKEVMTKQQKGVEVFRAK